MFHKGHLRLLERAKALGDYLIVGVTGENYDRSRGKLNVIESTQKRMQAIEAMKPPPRRKCGADFFFQFTLAEPQS